MIICSYILDIIFGDSEKIIKVVGHPVIYIGKLINFLEKIMLINTQNKNMQRFMGTILGVTTILVSAMITHLLLSFFYKISFLSGEILGIFICYQILAINSLKTESMKVFYAEKLDFKREQLSYIVGRQTENLNEIEVYKATIETISENTTDGVVAPMIYMFIGGAVGGIIYKSINTLDSMVGYKNEKYKYFGTFSARLDDVVNFLPARISAGFMIISSWILGFDTKNAYKIWKRDRKKHKSPNSAQTESVCAGALNVMLGGNATYFGKIEEKLNIGDNNREISANDIKKANILMYVTSFLVLFTFYLLKIIIERLI